MTAEKAKAPVLRPTEAFKVKTEPARTDFEMQITTQAAAAATLTPRQLIQVGSSCAPFAEADDLIELQPGAYDGDGVYALEYARPAGRNWSGLRRVRAYHGQVQIQEGAGDWVAVTEAARFIGKVCGVMKSRPRHTFMPELAI